MLQRLYTVIIVWHKESDLSVCQKNSKFCVPHQSFLRSPPLVHTSILYGHKWGLCTELWVKNSIRNALINNLPSSFPTNQRLFCVIKIIKWENKKGDREEWKRQAGSLRGKYLQILKSLKSAEKFYSPFSLLPKSLAGSLLLEQWKAAYFRVSSVLGVM